MRGRDDPEFLAKKIEILMIGQQALAAVKEQERKTATGVDQLKVDPRNGYRRFQMPLPSIPAPTERQPMRSR
jgi:hypothetical protein